MAGFHTAELRAQLRQLFTDAGYEKEELMLLVEAYEDLLVEYSELLAENERLKGEAKKPAARRTDTGYMSSKLWDAIHE